MASLVYVRRCQECGYCQKAKDPKTYKDQKSEAWRNIKCMKCQSVALDFGHYVEKEAGEKNAD